MAPALGTGIGLPFGGGPLGPAWAAGADMWEDFVANSGSLPTPTDTHAATIYAPNAAGVYLPFAANVLTRTDLGLQTVPTRTNLALYSTDASNAEWVSSNATHTAGQADLLGGTGAGLITGSGGAAAAFSAPNGVTAISYTNTTVYSFSRFVKAGTQTLVQLTAPSTAFGTGQYANFNLTTGAVVGSAGLTSSSITTFAGGWYRLTITLPATSTTLSINGGILAFINAAGDTRLPNFTGTTTFTDFGAQVEVGAFSSPLIVTTSTAATVNGNQQVISGLGTQLAVGVAGIVQFVLPGGTLNSSRIFEFDDGSGTNRAFGVADTVAISVQMTAAGAYQGAVVPLGIPATAGTLYTLAFSFSTNYINARLVGQAAVSADVLATWPVMDRLQIAGGDGNAGRNSYQFTRKLALKFGPQDATTFAAMYDKAVLAAAA